MSTISLSTKRVEYSNQFVKVFATQFKEAEISGNGMSFDIKKKTFDKFLITQGFTDYKKLPKLGSAEWNHFVSKRNKVRSELNSAAKIGQHGHPPFRIDATLKGKKSDDLDVRVKARSLDKDSLRVQLLIGMVMVTHSDAIETIKTLAKSKCKDVDKMTTFFAEHLNELPPEIHMGLVSSDANFAMVSSVIINAVDQYVKAQRHAYALAQKVLAERANTKILPTPQPHTGDINHNEME